MAVQKPLPEEKSMLLSCGLRLGKGKGDAENSVEFWTNGMVSVLWGGFGEVLDFEKTKTTHPG